MLPSLRQHKIIELLASVDFISIPELATYFSISIETARRDLNILDKEGKICKVYGGVKLKESNFGEITMETRLNSRLLQKEAIAAKCCELIHEGDCIFIDSGSTTYHMAKLLRRFKNLTVITNSLPVVNDLMDTSAEIILIGGKVRQEERSIVAFNYLFDFSQLNIQKAFICAGGITMENGVSDYNLLEAVTRKEIIKRSKEVILAADSSKFGKDVTIKIAELDQIDSVITDAQIDKVFVQQFKKNKYNLITT